MADRDERKRSDDPHARELERTPSLGSRAKDVEKDVSNRRDPDRGERGHAGPDTMEDVLDLDYERGDEGR